MQPKELSFEEACDIPEVLALPTVGMRKFVWWYAHNGCDVPNAAAEAGMTKANGYVIRQREDVSLALAAMAKRLLFGGTILAVQVATEIMNNVANSAGDRLRAAQIVLDRGGLGPTVKHDVKVERVMNQNEKLEMLKGIADKTGVSFSDLATKLLGPNRLEIDAVKNDKGEYDVEGEVF